MIENLSESIIVLAPSENDSTIATKVLREAGFSAENVVDLQTLCTTIENPVGAIILADESLYGEEMQRLQGLLGRQDSWSDLPIILIASPSKKSVSQFFSSSGNISLLERPFSRTALVRAVDVALRARKKQYQVRDLLTQQLRATRTRDEFFATLSHELRTPLSVILGWLEILRNNSIDSATSKNALEILDRNAKMQKSLIDDLLDMSRIITGKMHFEFSNLEFGIILKTIVRGFQPAAGSKQISLQLNLPDPEGHFPVAGDEQRLTQAISNLISNAIKFTPEGGRILVALKNKGDAYLLSVEDTGRGIDSTFLPSIFDRLKQEDMSATRTHGGLGLGLAITSHIVEAHHGSVKAFSDGRNKGTTMTMSLPRSNVRPVLFVPQGLTNPLVGSIRGTKVLAVDDCPDILLLLELFLGQAEAEVRLVDSATNALKELESFQPDVILSDIGMPQIDGYQLIKAIRNLPSEQGGQIPAIALTAYARDEERMRALNAGFQMHVSKPISNTELISAIASLRKQA